MTLFGNFGIVGKSLVMYEAASESSSDEALEDAQSLSSSENEQSNKARVLKNSKPIACCTIEKTNFFR